MDPGSATPPTSPDEDWHLEWRWGAAHPWMRPKVASSSCTSSSSSHSLRSLPTVLPPSASPFCSSSSPEPPPPSSTLPASCAVSPWKQTDLRDASAEKGESCVKDSALSTGLSTSSSWPVSLSFLPFFSSTQVHRTATASHQISASTPTAAAAAGPPVVELAHAAARSPPGIPVAESIPSEGGVKETEHALENIPETPPAQSVISTAAPGEMQMPREEGTQQEGSTAGQLLCSSDTLFRNISPAEIKADSESFTEKMERGAKERTGVETRFVPTTTEAALPSDVFAETSSSASSSPFAAPAAAAAAAQNASAAPPTSAAVFAAAPAVASSGAGEQRKLENTPHTKQRQVQELLLQFGDQTLSFLQRHQMTLWSVYAFRDWRVKTLVHALSAMGEPVNLVVVSCTPPPPPSDPSSSSSASSSWFSLSSRSSGSSVVSGGSSPSDPRSFSASSILRSYIPWLTTPAGVEKPRVLPAAEPHFGEQQNSISAAASDAGTTTAFAAATKGETSPDARRASLASASPAMGDDAAVQGGYSPLYHTIWLCGNRLWSPFELRRVLLHELVHAFDFARANISPDDCRHVACTEIRAYNLSGQCGWWRTRGYDIEQFNTVQPPLFLGKGSEEGTGSSKQEEHPHAYDNGRWQQTKRNRCLIHGALNSLGQHRRCHAPNVAEEAVREVFTRCVRDTWPFLAPPERDSKWRPSRMWRPEAAEFFKK